MAHITTPTPTLPARGREGRGASLRSVEELVAAGLVGEGANLNAVAQKYAVGITLAVADLIDRVDPHDPIARQFVPSAAELETTPEERADPIGDLSHSPVEGIVHRYPDRVLLKAVHVCPVYCRFCFRREMVGPQGLGTLTASELDAAIGYIAEHGIVEDQTRRKSHLSDQKHD